VGYRYYGSCIQSRVIWSSRERERYKADYGLCTIRVSHSLILPIGTMVRPITEVYIRLCPERRHGGWRMGDGVCRMRKASAEYCITQFITPNLLILYILYILQTTIYVLYTTDSYVTLTNCKVQTTTPSHPPSHHMKPPHQHLETNPQTPNY
jgi:hypothetical protein